MKMQSRHLTVFREVVRTSSFTGAARVLGYSQPAVSQQMRALEAEIGTSLFVRGARGLRLTPAGSVLARHAEVVLDAMEVAARQVRIAARDPDFTLKICTFPSAGSALVSEALNHTLLTSPDLRVDLVEREPPESLGLLTSGECDIVVAFSHEGAEVDASHRSTSEVITVPLLEDSMVVLVPHNHPLAERSAIQLKELDGSRWIVGCPQCRSAFERQCAASGIEPDVVCSTDDTLSVQSLVSAGLGVAYVPRLATAFLRHPGVAAVAVEPASTRQIAAHVWAESLRVPTVAAVVRNLRRVAASRLGSDT